VWEYSDDEKEDSWLTTKCIYVPEANGPC
jgi:hypothetical protein